MKLRNASYKLGRNLGWYKALQKSMKTGSAKPLLIRYANSLIGRHIVSKLWIRSKK